MSAFLFFHESCVEYDMDMIASGQCELMQSGVKDKPYPDCCNVYTCSDKDYRSDEVIQLTIQQQQDGGSYRCPCSSEIGLQRLEYV
uniref:Uncharacterized protein n=1 Tax=Timema cristinae TaxID=61476 RepID=A0A7R9GP85_TIMCR|nr:unnamed protein product [Timema cristinae]